MLRHREKCKTLVCAIHNKGDPGKLTASQVEQLKAQVSTGCFRNSDQIRDWIQSAFAVSYSPSGVKDLLKRIGVSYHKVTGFLWKADPDKQRAFVKRVARHKRQVKRADAPRTRRYYVDACHPVWGLDLVYGCWLLRGQRLLVGMGSGRKRLNILGAYGPDDHEYIDYRLTVGEGLARLPRPRPALFRPEAASATRVGGAAPERGDRGADIAVVRARRGVRGGLRLPGLSADQRVVGPGDARHERLHRWLPAPARQGGGAAAAHTGVGAFAQLRAVGPGGPAGQRTLAQPGRALQRSPLPQELASQPACLGLIEGLPGRTTPSPKSVTISLFCQRTVLPVPRSRSIHEGPSVCNPGCATANGSEESRRAFWSCSEGWHGQRPGSEYC
jgi:hypothetical protein